MIPERHNDWPSRLLRAVEEHRCKPFSWGESDCCLFVCDCILAMTGHDPAAPFRGRYRTALGAYRALRRYCGGGLGEIAAACGYAEVSPSMAQRGDVVLVNAPECQPGGKALGICLGVHIATQSAFGLIFEPRARALRAWRI